MVVRSGSGAGGRQPTRGRARPARGGFTPPAAGSLRPRGVRRRARCARRGSQQRGPPRAACASARPATCRR
ncbi:hypothetical protein D3228_04415 [Leucobacter luti]|nr:hypothetical protein [Leucobacter luti]